ncbi:uncharacterized protein LOC112528074 [Cynara cardunculus var. scolymus]|uniref:Uncharacterized protein n=1 Tax=Cynara cardunculus var. scolymus TaxID=59895 RepID=A0A103XSU2_CYNCS|nr:uncharacterized protein LOC112528074 [Cynara cardunculus var. scolymus]KVH96224.1 hypothetical protein Ccrd_001692 [Cynara cardunculus var. scolymus]
MASSILPHSPFLSSRPILKTRNPKPHTGLLVFASKRDANGHMVDESMIVLRKRIHEMKMIEQDYEPPSDWMGWEKSCYTSYDAYICEVMGVLQSGLMNTRPSLALGLMALIMLSVPVSTVVVASNAVEVAKMVLNGLLH